MIKGRKVYDPLTDTLSTGYWIVDDKVRDSRSMGIETKKNVRSVKYMKNRHLFKAKRKDNQEWVRGSLVYTFTGTPYIVTEYDHILNFININEVDTTTICQCTGLKDKNGKLIWENDIANCMDAECCGYISWNESEAGFYFNILLEDRRFEEEHIYDYQDGIEVIGNIFDNPELLESEE